MPQKPAIFLDRDNTLIHDDGYIFEIEKFAWITGAVAALRRFHQAKLSILGHSAVILKMRPEQQASWMAKFDMKISHCVAEIGINRNGM